MHRPYQTFTSLIVIVAALALVGGIAIVLVTSRDSLSFAPEIWFGSNPTGEPTAAPAGASPTTGPEATLAPTSTAPPTAVAATATPAATRTLAPTPELTATPGTGLPEGVTAIAEVVLDGVAARVRDTPGGTVIGALLRGTRVEMLLGREVVAGVTWVEIRDDTGLIGWMSEDLLQIVSEVETPAQTPTASSGTAVTALPTLAGGVRGLATVQIQGGASARLRDAPGGTVIDGLPDGTPVEVLQGREVLDGITWIEIRDDTGQTGWIAEDLLLYTSTPQPE